MKNNYDWSAVRGYLVDELRNYAHKYKMNGFVVGISGGIDSAVVSKLCALTGLETRIVLLPIKQQAAELKRAQDHATFLTGNYNNVRVIKHDLSMVHDSFMMTMNTPLIGKLDTADMLSEANVRARLRMTALYFHAGINKMIVAGTGNKVEDFGVGFFTKYGDGGVDVSPIGDLYKTEVYELGKALGIIVDIMNAKPTDGLWADGRSDEDQIGASYAELEWAMEFIKDHPAYGYKSLGESFANGDIPLPKALDERQRKVLKIYLSRHFANMHKMDPIPVFKINQPFLIEKVLA